MPKTLYEPAVLVVPLEQMPALWDVLGKVNAEIFRGHPPRSVLMAQIDGKRFLTDSGRLAMQVEVRFVPVHLIVDGEYDTADFSFIEAESDDAVIVGPTDATE